MYTIFFHLHKVLENVNSSTVTVNRCQWVKEQEVREGIIKESDEAFGYEG